jgi:CubicO group peptidase (beta-lactamase class C family)
MSQVHADPTFQSFAKVVAERLDAASKATMTPGVLVGASRRGERMLYADGIANLNTDAPMTLDTAFLLGSVTKVLTTALLLKQVEQGRVDLDDQVVKVLPEFRLNQPGLAEKITVRQLVNHTNGIDADVVMPSEPSGPAAVAGYVAKLAGCGLLFEPGTNIHYTNPGMSVAGRIIETLTGKSYNQALEEDLFAPLGMSRSCTSARQAILHRTAIGSRPDAALGRAVATGAFMGPDSPAAAGATPIVTLEDLLAFGETMLRQGKAPGGGQWLDTSLADAMSTVSFDLGSLGATPIGLGWWLAPVAGTTAWWHGGGSPGGCSALVVLPEADLVIAAFGNSSAAFGVLDVVVNAAIEDLAGGKITPQFVNDPTGFEAWRCAGTFASHQFQQVVEATDDGLRLSPKFLPMDADHAAVMTAFMGSLEPSPPYELVPVGPQLLKPKGAPDEAFAGVLGRMGLTYFNTPGEDGRFRFAHAGFRSPRRAD